MRSKTRFPGAPSGRGAERLFAAYVEAKQRPHVLDYDDLLLYWLHLMASRSAGASAMRRALRSRARRRVPGHQRAAGARSCCGSRPTARGVTVVGDDAQAIYAFRAATRAQHPAISRSAFRRAARVVTLEAELPLDAAHPGRGQRRHRRWPTERFTKNLFSRARRRRAAAAGRPPPTRSRRSTTSSTSVLEAARGRRAAEAAGGPVPRRASPRRAGGRARAPQHPLRQVRRAQVPRGGARQGRALRPALGGEPARRAWRRSACCSCCRASVPAAAAACRRLAAADWAFAALASFAPSRRRPRAERVAGVRASCSARLRGDAPWAGPARAASGAGTAAPASASTTTRRVRASAIWISWSRSRRVARRASGSSPS